MVARSLHPMVFCWWKTKRLNSSLTWIADTAERGSAIRAVLVRVRVMTGNLPLRLPAASIGPAGSARPASVDVTWREHLKKIPAPARPFFSNPPGQRVEDYPTYIEFINRAL